MVARVCANFFKEAKIVENTDKNLVQNHLYLPSDSRPPLPPAYLFLVARKFTLTGYERQRPCLSLSWLPPQSPCLWLVERQPQLGLWLGGAASAMRRPKLGSSREAGKRKSVQGNLKAASSVLMSISSAPWSRHSSDGGWGSSILLFYQSLYPPRHLCLS